MTDKNPIWRRYRDLLRPRPADDVADEVKHHLEMRRKKRCAPDSIQTSPRMSRASVSVTSMASSPS